jgi:predicted CXXCH cytochrome family protein
MKRFGGRAIVPAAAFLGGQSRLKAGCGHYWPPSSLFGLLIFLAANLLFAQSSSEPIGMHDLSPSGDSPVRGRLPGSCYYCHAPHSGVGGLTPLWNQKLSTQVYTAYTSTTSTDSGNPKPPQSSPSTLCLSCHDGTVAPGQTQAYGAVPISGPLNSADVLDTAGTLGNLQSSHPFSLGLPLKDAPYLAASLVASGTTLDKTGAVKLIKGNVECTSCHSAHVQAIDKVSRNFLVLNSADGAMCLACHDPKRVMTGKINPLANWTTSVHATAANAVTNTPPAPPLGSYHSVKQNACISCHAPHNGLGPTRLLRGANEQDCLTCHNGSSAVYPSISNVAAEYAAGKVGHPIPTGNFPHDAAESVLLNRDRHATCVDCHNAHSSNPVTAFPPPPGTRLSQSDVAGISAADGVTVVNPTVNQFENCLRCHGTSTGKAANPVYGYLPMWTVSAGDPLNVIPQFALNASSSHPVMHDSSSPLPQPSLLPYMLNLDGVTQGRAMGVRILCTDCHNSDDNREFGGTGPNGPHGSKFTHILERRYEFSRAPRPGLPVMDLFPNPDLSVAGPYALCGKCHNLTTIMANTSFSRHSLHINAGFSCSACHTAHGMGSQSAALSGERLVNFDANVVAPNGPNPISYSHAQNTCNLVCHGQAHGAATSLPGASPARIGKVGHR